MLANRLATVSIFFLIYGVVALIKVDFQHVSLVYVLVLGILLYKIIKEIIYMKNCFREYAWMGAYALALNVFFYGIILVPPITWIKAWMQ
jgi:hypothetical protein